MSTNQKLSAASLAAGDTTEIFLPGDAVRVSGKSAQLVGGKCDSCSLETFPRYAVCPGCMSEDVAEVNLPGEGAVYSLSTVHVGAPRWHKPLTLGYVDLTNGVRVFSHLAGNCKIGDLVTIGLAEVGREKTGIPINSFIFQTAAR
jgi:uncharacterized OB-fold protein